MKYIIYWILIIQTTTESPLIPQADKFGRLPSKGLLLEGGTCITINEELKAFSREFGSRESALQFAAEAKLQPDIRGVEIDSTDWGWRLVHPDPNNPYEVTFYKYNKNGTTEAIIQKDTTLNKTSFISDSLFHNKKIKRIKK